MLPPAFPHLSCYLKLKHLVAGESQVCVSTRPQPSWNIFSFAPKFIVSWCSSCFQELLELSLCLLPQMLVTGFRTWKCVPGDHQEHLL